MSSATGLVGDCTDSPPTRESLQLLSKVQLRKSARGFKLKGIFEMSKPELISRIMDKVMLLNQAENETQLNVKGSVPENGLEQIMKEITKLKDGLRSKDAEIAELRNVIGDLRERLSAVENRQTVQDILPPNPQTPPPKRTLLLGDSNLSEVRNADLGLTTRVQTINGGNIDLIDCWVNEQLNWSPDTCILCAGMQDISEGATTDKILDDIGVLVTKMKEANEHLEIAVCELAPLPVSDETLIKKMDDFNKKLSDWCPTNGVSVIKTTLPFKLSSGDVDDLCFSYDEENKIHALNRLGAIRLLSTIAKQNSSFTLCQNWEETKHKHLSPRHVAPNRDNKQREGPSQGLTGSFDRSRKGDKYFSQTNRRFKNNGNVSQANRRWRHQEPRHSNNFREYRHRHQEFRQSSNHWDYRPRRYTQHGCYNCGEFDHQQSQCSFNYQIRCSSCDVYGHHSGVCVYYNA